LARLSEIDSPSLAYVPSWLSGIWSEKMDPPLLYPPPARRLRQ